MSRRDGDKDKKDWEMRLRMRRITGHICHSGRVRPYSGLLCSSCYRYDPNNDIEWPREKIDEYNRAFDARVKYHEEKPNANS